MQQQMEVEPNIAFAFEKDQAYAALDDINDNLETIITLIRDVQADVQGTRRDLQLTRLVKVEMELQHIRTILLRNGRDQFQTVIDRITHCRQLRQEFINGG